MCSAPIDRPSPNHDARPDGVAVDMLILHYTGMRSGAAALERLIDPAAKVSAHYLVEEDGQVFRLVDEARRAWHAGVSSWAGRTRLNDVSIGIEIANPGHEWGLKPFSDVQIEAVIALSRNIVARWRIPKTRVLGHSDVAPTRKADPGELFPWRRLADAGVGLWPAPAPRSASRPSVVEAQRLLARFGFAVEPCGDLDAATMAAAAAFQRRFRPSAVDGCIDGECAAMLAALAEAAATPGAR